MGAWHQHGLADYLSVVMWLWLWLDCTIILAIWITFSISLISPWFTKKLSILYITKSCLSFYLILPHCLYYTLSLTSKNPPRWLPLFNTILIQYSWVYLTPTFVKGIEVSVLSPLTTPSSLVKFLKNCLSLESNILPSYSMLFCLKGISRHNGKSHRIS
jgi:hypothetical protein